jgi:hypothetical protein
MHLLKRTFTLSFLCMTVAILIICILVFISPKSTGRKGGFRRKFTSNPVISLLHSQKINGLRAVCGIENNHIYFETDTVGHIIEYDTTLSDLHDITFQIPEKKSFQSLYSTFMDSSYCYITGGNIPAIIRFNQKDLSWQLFHFPDFLFSQAVLINHGSFVLRAYQKFNGKWDQVFSCWNPIKNALFTRNDILQKRGDAGISTDGILLFDKGTQRVLFVSYYSNTLICMDTTLNIAYRAHTIDSEKREPVKVAVETHSYSKIMTNSSPLNLVNRRAKIANHQLYIQAAIQADNESSEHFSDNAVIDVYRMSDGLYLHSFYIPKYKSKKLINFEVSGQTIIVLYDGYVVIYSLPFSF